MERREQEGKVKESKGGREVEREREGGKEVRQRWISVAIKRLGPAASARM